MKTIGSNSSASAWLTPDSADDGSLRNCAFEAMPAYCRVASTHRLTWWLGATISIWVFLAYAPHQLSAANGTQIVAHDREGDLIAQTTATTAVTPVIVAQPSNALGQIGGVASFSVNAGGTTGLSYQWMFNGATISALANPSAATDTLVLSNLSAASFGGYSIVVRNGAGSVTSQSAVLQLDSLGDGIPDSWKAQYFGANWATLANTAASADFDGDGISNRQEYLDGTSPADATAHYFTLTVSGGNAVMVSPAGRRFAPGTGVTLTAPPVGDLQCGGWSGDVTSVANPLTLTMYRNYAVTALYGTMPPQDRVPYFTVPSFTQSNADTRVRALAVDHYGNLMVAGSFQAAGSGDAHPQNGIARLAQAGYVDTSFVPPTTALTSNSFAVINGEVDAVAIQSDDKILIGGGFGVARLNYDGSQDFSFSTAAITSLIEINQIVVRPSDGKILVVGYVSSRGSNGIVQLNADGSEDTTFAASLTTIDQVAWQNDGKVIYRNNSVFGRLNPNGSTDSTYAPAISGCDAMALRADGELYVASGGNLGPDPDATITEYLLRSNGSIDPAFNPPTNAQIDNPHTIAVLPDGGFVVDGGIFIDHGGGNYTQEALARFRPDGSLVTGLFGAFTYDTSDYSALAVDRTGNLLVGGSFVTLAGQEHLNLGRVNLSDGSVDSAFTPEFSSASSISGITTRPNGETIVWGDFNVVNGFYSPYLGLLINVGYVYRSFLGGSGSDAPVRAAVIQPDGKTIIAGEFRSVNGQPSTAGIARYNGDGGDLDTGFVDAITLSGLDTYYGPPRALALQRDGKILIGGDFRTISNVSHLHLARLNADGSLDTSFNPSANDTIYSIVVQPDGKILVGGRFTQVNGSAAVALARLNADGSLDATLNAANLSYLMTGVVYSIALQPDGRILAGGRFTTNNLSLTSIPGAGLTRLNSDGSPDTAFNAAFAGTLNLVNYLGVTLKALAVQPDGHIIAAGNFPVNGYPNLGDAVRINANGTLDPTFLAFGAPNAVTTSNQAVFVNAIALMANGSVLLGGSFSQIGGQGRLAFTRLVSTNNILPGDLSANGGGGVALSLVPSAVSPLISVAIEQSTDGAATFQLLGAASPVGDGSWLYNVPSVPAGAVYYRALVTDINQEQARSDATGPIGGAPSVTSVLTATGYVGTPFSYTATASTSLTSFTASGLPAWANGVYDSNAGTLTITGTPTAEGISSVRLRPGNANGMGSATLSLTVFNRFAGWAANNFTAAELQNPAISGSLGDATGAGIKNLIKYALGIPPKRLGVAGLPTLGQVQLGNGRYLTLTYTHDALATDVALTVEVSGDLSAWNSGAAVTAEISRTDNGDGTETVVTRDNTAMSTANRRFIRLRVSQ